MKSNIFWRCTRRQPIRTVLLLLLVVGVVFAFTARAAEYLLLRQETERLGSYYKAVGGLSFLGGGTDAASFDEAKAFLESDPRVAYTAWNEETSAILQGMYNADILGYNTEDTIHANYYFTVTLLGIVERRAHDGLPTAFRENGDWACTAISGRSRSCPARRSGHERGVLSKWRSPPRTPRMFCRR